MIAWSTSTVLCRVDWCCLADSRRRGVRNPVSGLSFGDLYLACAPFLSSLQTEINCARWRFFGSSFHPGPPCPFASTFFPVSSLPCPAFSCFLASNLSPRKRPWSRASTLSTKCQPQARGGRVAGIPTSQDRFCFVYTIGDQSRVLSCSSGRCSQAGEMFPGRL